MADKEQSKEVEKFTVDDAETVFRLISSPLGYSEVTGVSPDCFRLFRKNESYVSVEREKFCPLEDALKNGENIKKWFAEGDSFWGAATLNVEKIRQHTLLDVISKYTDAHPGHAGILMFLAENLMYRNKVGEPTPMEILVLQTYLSSIVEEVHKSEVSLPEVQDN